MRAIIFKILINHLSGVEAPINKEYILAFGANVRRIRKAKKMTMEKLAQEAGLEYSQIARIELGEINPKITTVHAIAKGLTVSEKELFDFNI